MSPIFRILYLKVPTFVGSPNWSSCLFSLTDLSMSKHLSWINYYKLLIALGKPGSGKSHVTSNVLLYAMING